jgi:hypothetical protein
MAAKRIRERAGPWYLGQRTEVFVEAHRQFHCVRTLVPFLALKDQRSGKKDGTAKFRRDVDAQLVSFIQDVCPDCRSIIRMESILLCRKDAFLQVFFCE